MKFRLVDYYAINYFIYKTGGREYYLDVSLNHTIWASLHGLTSLLITYPEFDWGEQERLIQFHIRTLIQGLKN
ncbi:hypothetical protein [Sporosarcina sp. FA9]|uniref:hypothetical protein n=1 Tax=Sporosarcina sp. FA9 TaxID=3413030 RepID=UPI003F658266